ncbi:MAG TPA: peptidoglycan DD-metalloendopeptidase family protein [Luteibaculaceae bacterium]|nr:peptidoglycan DD-metalloendopeptidase family protein [Luteibaculaceae bacterium]
MPPFRSSLLLLICLSVSSGLWAQDKKKLEKKRAELNAKIKQTNQLLEKTKTEQKSKQIHLQALSSQIKLREELIQTIGSEVGQLNNSIEERNKNIAAQQTQLSQLKSEYARLLQLAQRTQSSYDRMVFVFSAATFNQALKRLRYLQEYTAFRRLQAQKIDSVQLALNKEVQALSDQKIQKKVLLSSKEQEKNRLASDKTQEEKTLAQLKSQEQSLRAELQKQQAERTKITREIERLLSAEIKKSKSNNKGTFKLAPAAKLLSSDFENNQGKLPWPVDKGFISGRFGKQPHPVIKNIMIENNGIDITTDKEAAVKAVFKGTVSSILIIPGAGKVVVLDHGAYRSIYTQLKEVNVSKGQQVSTRDKLGICLPNESGSRSEAHLEIWKIGQDGTQKLNPALWLSK